MKVKLIIIINKKVNEFSKIQNFEVGNIMPEKRINIKLNETTHKKIKLIANIKGVTISELINNILEKEINEIDFNLLIENEL